MSDWRQIQARIRKARTSPDPPGQLAALYERTRDAMVAFELAQIHEKSGAHSEAARWYTSAAERFRRAQWKSKAEEALIRLGAPIPVTPAAVLEGKPIVENASPLEPIILEIPEEPISEIEVVSEASVVTIGGQPESKLNPEGPTSGGAPGTPGHRRKRRGRRGGRGRNKNARPGTPGVATLTPVAVLSPVSERVIEMRPEAAAPHQEIPEIVPAPRKLHSPRWG